MRIGIDIRCLQTLSRFRGIGSYAYNLVFNILSENTLNEYFLILFKNQNLEFSFPKTAKENLCYVPYPGLYHMGWLKDKFLLNKDLEKYGFDAVHFTSPFEFFFGNNLKERTSFKKIVTVHDLTPLIFSQQIFSGKWHRKFLKFFYLRLLKSISCADKIIAVSQSTAKDLIQKLNMPKNKLTVIYEGADEKFYSVGSNENIKKVKEKYNLPDEFMLYVGGFAPNKNIEFLLNIIKKVKLPLVMAGRRREEDKKFLSGRIKGAENLVYFPDFVPEDDLPLLYKASKIFVFPSLYEGFGLPPLEAMACGVPVISSNTSSLPEVMGDAGILIGPRDETAWVNNIQNLWNNEKLRKEFSSKGAEQAKKFSWGKTAVETIEAYKEAVRNTSL